MVNRCRCEIRACGSSSWAASTPVRANRSRTEIPCAASSAASAPRPRRFCVGASGLPGSGVTTLIGFTGAPALLAQTDLHLYGVFNSFWQLLTSKLAELDVVPREAPRHLRDRRTA